jgi:hypothetical protein
MDAPPNSTVPLSDDFSARDVTLYGVLGVLFGALLASGFALYDPHPGLGGFLSLVGAGGLIVMVILLIWYRLKIIHALIVTIAALLATWAIFAYVLWTKPNEVIVHDPPTAEDIAKATVPIIAERDAAIKERDTARQELDAARHGAIPPSVVSSPTPQPEWSASEIAARTELWHSIQNAVNDASAPIGPVIVAYNYGDKALNIWETYIKQKSD